MRGPSLGAGGRCAAGRDRGGRALRAGSVDAVRAEGGRRVLRVGVGGDPPEAYARLAQALAGAPGARDADAAGDAPPGRGAPPGMVAPDLPSRVGQAVPHAAAGASGPVGEAAGDGPGRGRARLHWERRGWGSVGRAVPRRPGSGGGRSAPFDRTGLAPLQRLPRSGTTPDLGARGEGFALALRQAAAEAGGRCPRSSGRC